MAIRKKNNLLKQKIYDENIWWKACVQEAINFFDRLMEIAKQPGWTHKFCHTLTFCCVMHDMI